MNITENTTAHRGDGEWKGRYGLTARRFVLGVIAVGALLLAIPVAANANVGLGATAGNRSGDLANPVNFGNAAQGLLPRTLTIWFYNDNNNIFGSQSSSNNFTISGGGYRRNGGSCNGTATGTSWTTTLNGTASIGGNGNSCSIILELQAGTAVGTAAGTISFTSNRTIENGNSRSLTGVVEANNPVVQIWNSTNTVEQTVQNFPGTLSGTNSATYTFTMRNAGNLPLTDPNTQSITGMDDSSFSITGTTCGSTLAIGATCTVTTRFNPPGAITDVARTATLTISPTYSGTPYPDTVTLNGTALAQTRIPALFDVTNTLPVSSTDFGQIGVGVGAQANQTFTLRNTGNWVMAGPNIQSISGPDAGDFSIPSTTCGATISSGGTCQVTVRFEPGAIGIRNATLNVTPSDATSGSPATISLTGEGVPPTFIPALYDTAGTTPKSSHAFPDTIGTTLSAPYVFTFTNEGNATLTGTGAANQVITGPDASQFTISATTCGGSVLAGESCTISVRFAPSTEHPDAAETSNATLEINTTNGSPASVSSSLSGTSIPAISTPEIRDTGNTAVLPTREYGSLPLGETDSYTFTIRNNGNVNLNGLALSRMVISGPDASQFTRSTDCPSALAPNATCTMSVDFSPTTVGVKTATLRLGSVSGDPVGDPIPGDPGAFFNTEVSLSGTATAANPSLEIFDTAGVTMLDSHVFTAGLGANQPYVFTLRNTGNVTLSGVTNQVVTGGNASEFSRTTTCGATLAPGASCTTTITFAPARTGIRWGTLTVSPTNAFVTPAPTTLELVGNGTGVRIDNDQSDNLTGVTQKRWLDTLTLSPGGSIPSDTIRVSFAVDIPPAMDIADVQIGTSTTTNDTPVGTYQGISGLLSGDVTVERKPGSNQAFVRAQVPLSSTSLGTGNGQYGFSNGGTVSGLCVNIFPTGDYKTDDRRVWFRVQASDGTLSPAVGSRVRFNNQNYTCPQNHGPQISSPRVLSVDGVNLPFTSQANADKGAPAVFQFNTRAKSTINILDQTTTAFPVTGINWRIRNSRTGAMFRIVNGSYAACAAPCIAEANYAQGAKHVFADSAQGQRTLPIPGIPSRGRWIVEGAPQTTEDEDDAHFFSLGVLRVNDSAPGSPSVDFGGTLGPRPNSDTVYSVIANSADPADPINTFDSEGGRVEVIEWDLDGNTSNGPLGDGFELRFESASASDLPSQFITRNFDTTGKTPGPYTVRVRVTDNGAFMASDSVARQRVYEYTTTINSPPVGTSETIFLEADQSQPADVEFRAADANNDPYRVDITPDPGNDGTLGGNLNGGIGQNTKPYTWPAAYTGTDEFEFVTTDDKDGVADPATLTVKVRPNTSIDNSVIAGALLNPDLGDPNKRFLGSTTTTDAAFDFSSPQAPVNAFECRLLNDGVVIEDWASCASAPTGTISYTGLSDGLHRFEVRAVNDDGDADGTPDFRTWRVDNTAPVTEVRVGPASNLPNQQPRLTNDTTPSYIFRATADERSQQEYMTYECRTLFGPESGTWQACGAPADTDGSGPVDIVGTSPDFGITDPLPEGTYAIEVRATDEVGNLGPVLLETFTVDTSPPVTALASGPEGLVNTRDLEYVLSSSEGESTFTCKLERRDPGPSLTEIFPLAPCPGPAADGSRPTFTVPTDGEYVLTAIATDPATNPDPTPLEIEFEVDATEPETALDPLVDFGDGPTSARRTQSRKVDVTFSGSDSRQLSGFECRLDSTDDLDWALCESVQRFGGLSDGDHRLEIRSRDEAGNFDSTPEVLEWTVDRTPPVTTIDVAPDPVDNDASPSVEFSVNETADSICSLNNQPWVACTSPVSVSSLNGGNPLADGPHTLAIRSTDIAGNVEMTSALASWTTDTVSPVVEFTSTPNDFEPQGDVDYGWSVKDGSPPVDAPEVQAECSYDGAAFTACDRMIGITAPTNGVHTFSVRATDQGGNVSSDATHSFEILGEPPVAPVIDNSDPVAGSTTRFGSVRVAFSHPDEAEGSFAGFQCRLDGVAWIPCDSPFESDGLGDGAHTFDVRALDVAQNIGPAVSMSWEVQAGAPVTTIDSGPNGLVSDTDAQFSFSSDKDGTFECRIDGAPWAPCSSPLELSGLADGPHSLSVRAVSSVVPVGVKDPTPPTRNWTVDSTAPGVQIDSAPTGTVVSSSAQVTFSSADSEASFQCKVGAGLFDTCASPLNLSGLAAGEVTVTVRAVDAAGNVSATPAEASWTVEEPTCPDGFEGTPPDCTELPLVEGPGIKATLTGGELSLASLGAVELPADQVTLDGVRATDGRWFVAPEGVVFEPVVQTIPDALGPGTNVEVTISITALGAGRGTLPSGGGAATFKLPVRADVQAKLGAISVIPPGTECSLRPVVFDLTGTYDATAKTVSLTSPSISFPKVTGCASFKQTIDALLELPRSDIEMTLDFALEDIASECPAGQVGTPPNCVPAAAALAEPTVKAPKKVKSGKPVTITASVRNSGNATASNVRVCLTLKKAAKLAKGKARRCRTVRSVAAGKSGIVRFKVRTRPISSSRAKLNYSVSATAAGGTRSGSRTGHVTLMK
jgi:hypothetical protein